MTQKNRGDFVLNHRLHAALVMFVICGFFACAEIVFAQDVSVSTRVEPAEVSQGQTFSVIISVKSKGSNNVSPISAPQLPGATLVNQSTGKQINGTFGTNEAGNPSFIQVITNTYRYDYVADKQGSLAVPPVEVSANGQKIKTNSTRIKVLPPGSTPPRQQARRRRRGGVFGSDPFADNMNDAFNQLLQRRFGGGGNAGFQAIPPGTENSAFFIVAEVDKTEVYEGEQLKASWYLYSKTPGVREIDTLKYPDLEGFWKEDIQLATLLNFKRGELEGQLYNKALLASYALFPIEPGKATIDEYRAKLVISNGFGRAIRGTKASKSIPILVKPLPADGQPENFSGAVGKYNVARSVEDMSSVVSHQPFVMTVRLDGKGNAKSFELPDLGLPDHVEIYDVKKESKFFKSGKSFKEFQVYLIPRQEGELVLPEMKVSYFDPEDESYHEITAPSLTLNVLKGSGQQGLASSRLQKQKDKEPLQIISQWEPSSKDPRPNGILWAVFFLASTVGGFGFAAVQLEWFRKQVSFSERLKERVREMDRLLAAKDWRQLGVQGTNCIYFLLAEVSTEGGADVPFDQLIEKCPPSVRQQLGGELKKSLSQFHLLGFGPDGAVSQMAKDEEKVSAMVSGLKTLTAQTMKLMEKS